jgi:hypothetical protein
MRVRLQARQAAIGPAAACAGLLILCGLVVGCESLLGGRVEAGAGPTISAVRHPILDDIPKPAGFTLVDDRSVATTSGRFRVAKVEFVGRTDRDDVNRFYKEYMPSAGFTLKRESFDRGEYEMHFQSGTEMCMIRVRPERSGTAIVLEVLPMPEGSAEREAKPVTPRP